MNSLIRIASASNKTFSGNPLKSAEQIISVIKGLTEIEPDLILFPKYSLIGDNCGDLLKNKSVISLCDQALELILNATQRLDSYIILGGILDKNGKPEDVSFLLHKGEVLAIVGDDNIDFAFYVEDIRIGIFTKNLSTLPLYTSQIADSGCDVLLIPAYEKATALSLVSNLNLIQTVSIATASCVVVANGGIGGTSSPAISKGYTAFYECGEQLCLQASLYEECVEVCDIDGDIIHANKASASLPVCNDIQEIGKPANNKAFLMRKLSQTPYLPNMPQLRSAYLADLFNLQTASLVRRMQNINISKLLIGVSGGLDSTLALLVCAQAMDELGLDHSNIIAVTMQGLGTSDKTYDNANSLMNALGCTIKDISIKQAVLNHLADIGHNTTDTDVTFENAQARERTQILFDLANMNSGIVVGTGDLSELSLGFCTFGGDALASFNVNSCLNKTVIREMVAFLATAQFEAIKQTLTAILDTPISPELLPLSNEGDIQQKTEVILGEYELHDFFLYYFIKYSFAPQKLLDYAVTAFKQKYSAEYIRDKLKIFLKRFITSQFKRSCAVDSADITEVNLNGFTMPSDLSNSEIFSSQI